MMINRRDFLRYSKAAGFILATNGLGAFISGCLSPREKADVTKTEPLSYAYLDPKNPDNFNAPLNLPGREGLLGILDAPATTTIAAKQEVLEVLKGKNTGVFVYEVNQDGKTYINPTIRIKKGSSLSATLLNNLNEMTIIHWHGLHVDWRADGHPSYAVGKGGSYSYNFQVQNRGGTYWYHPHPMGITGRQAYLGLAGFFIVEDEDEIKLRNALDLKLGETDLPVVIQDKRFDVSGNLIYQPSPMEWFMGLLGDVVLVNLAANPYLEVSTRIYRFRVLNGSNARIYKLAFVKGGDKLPYRVIGTDGGLLDKPYQATELFISPAERVDILLDLRNLRVGDTVFLKSLAFDPMEREEMGSMMSGMPSSRLGSGEEFYILKLMVKDRVAYDREISQTLSSVQPLDTSNADRRINLSQSMMRWLINGKTFKMDEYPITVSRNSTEIWEITNEERSMPHPMHIHGFQFQVLERKNSPEQVKNLAVDSRGRSPVDLGWKDTVLIWPGETLRAAINFSHNFTGKQIYLFHCHILEHEDMGMMINYKVI